MALPPAGWFPDSDHPGLERWWDGARWSENWRKGAQVTGGFKVRYKENLPNKPVRTVESAQAFETLPEAQAAVDHIIRENFDGKLPSGYSLEIFRLTPAGTEESYGKWLGKRFARIGVAAAIGTAIGFMIGQ